MGYESRLYIGTPLDAGGCEKPYFDEYARVDLSCMPTPFRGIFKEDADFRILSDGDEEEIKEDKYGAPLKCASVDEVYQWCLDFAKEETYHRNTILMGVLRGFIDAGHGGFTVAHYGY